MMEEDIKVYLQINDWFLSNKRSRFSELECYIMKNADEVSIKKETQKAVYVRFRVKEARNRVVSICRWFPKSVLGLAPKEGKGALVDSAIEAGKTFRDRCQSGEMYYDQVLALAKKKGIKHLRKGLKLITIMEKISEAGISLENFFEEACANLEE